MSQLTKFQIRARIEGMKSSLDAYAKRGDASAAQRTRRKLDTYEAELRKREASGSNPSAGEIQKRIFGEMVRAKGDRL